MLPIIHTNNESDTYLWKEQVLYKLPGEKVLYDAFPLSNMTSVALYMTPVLNHLSMENITTLYILRSYLSINCFKLGCSQGRAISGSYIQFKV